MNPRTDTDADAAARELTVVAQVRAQPGTVAQLVAAQTVLVEATRQEEGCIRYDLHVSTDEPDLVLFIETWASEAAWQTHMQGPAVQAFREAAGHLVGEFNLRTYRQIA